MSSKTAVYVILLLSTYTIVNAFECYEFNKPGSDNAEETKVECSTGKCYIQIRAQEYATLPKKGCVPPNRVDKIVEINEWSIKSGPTGTSFNYFCDTDLCNTIGDADAKLLKKHTTSTSEIICRITGKPYEFTVCDTQKRSWCGYKKNIASGRVWMGCRWVPAGKRNNIGQCFETETFIEHVCDSSFCSTIQSCKTWETGVKWPFEDPPTTTTKKPTTTTKKPTTTLASTTTSAKTKAGNPTKPSELSNPVPDPPSLDESGGFNPIETSSVKSTGSRFTVPTVTILGLYAGVYFTL